ncbi:hypothetical protein BB560_004662 [Smittium megazygosporum]|uniref:Uncharacterized protein n=1 Tax=Smittium megazygosporum TaxID=133381 RepID=A0A2T9Z8T6_9FUNG|nr:hypothetical protein BB560_006740 [Smittium megazygosporum]PVV00937.1 hypothetical protein BB560_004662 [Smittium megazygosporum]
MDSAWFLYVAILINNKKWKMENYKIFYNGRITVASVTAENLTKNIEIFNVYVPAVKEDRRPFYQELYTSFEKGLKHNSPRRFQYDHNRGKYICNLHELVSKVLAKLFNGFLKNTYSQNPSESPEWYSFPKQKKKHFAPFLWVVLQKKWEIYAKKDSRQQLKSAIQKLKVEISR